jgi:DNA-binding XRE family transcriptional regulator
MPRGKQPDEKLRQRIVKFRGLGLSFGLIAKRLKCSRQTVHEIWKRTSGVDGSALHCQECRADILKDNGRTPGRWLNNGAVFCLDCLAKHPEATFGQRLKAHRLAAGMTLRDLSRKIGLGRTQLSRYERGAVCATRPSLVKLLRVFGVALVNVWGKDKKSHD